MPRYVALLRGINVGGHRLIKMDALRAMFEELKFRNVVTYIQSGNVAFDSTARPEALRKKIESHLMKSLGYEVLTIVRAQSDVQAIVDADLFPKAPFLAGDHTTRYVGFLSEEPTPQAARAVEALSTEVDVLRVVGGELYIAIHKDKGESKLDKIAPEKKLGVSVTVRNWNSVNKLASL